MKKYLVEFIGTYFLMLFILMIVNTQATVNAVTIPLAPLGIGLGLIGLIYAGGHISKAHYNPAVTLAFWINKDISNDDVMGYLVAQLVAAMVAAFTARYLLGAVDANALTVADYRSLLEAAVVAEILGTFALVFVILNVAIAKGTAGNTFYGIAIGFTVVALAYSFGGISGGAFNPVVGLGLCAAGMVTWSSLWIYVIANALGAALAAVCFKYLED